jgi:hypothetical protein
MEAESRAERAARGAADTDQDRDVTITIRLPSMDPELRQWFCDFFPGRALFRVLSNPPDEVLEHSRNARRERLLAFRSFVDALIEDNDRPRSRQRSGTRRVEID